MIDYTDSGCPWSLLLQRRGSVIPSSLMSTTPSVAVALLLFFCGNSNLIDDFTTHFERVFSGEDIKASQLWAAMTGTVLFLIGFRTNKAYSRFWDGTTLLHQMWGEWFDAVSCLIAFSHSAKKTRADEVANFRHTLVRLMSLCHASAMEEISMSIDSDDEPYPTLDLTGLDLETVRYLKDCKEGSDLTFNRVEVLVHMIQTLIVHSHEIGVLSVPAPILSRVFQTISRGQVNLANCKKITTTLFPFPYAQLIPVLLGVVSIITPMVMFSICGRSAWAVIFTLLPIFGLYALNGIARELEMPFGRDPNDLPLHDFQMHMNSSLLMLTRKEADHVPSTDLATTMDFEAMQSRGSTSSKYLPRVSVAVHLRRTMTPKQIGAPPVDEADPPTPLDPLDPLDPPAPPAPRRTHAPAPGPVASGGFIALQRSAEDLSEKFEAFVSHTLVMSNELRRSQEALEPSSGDADSQQDPVLPDSRERSSRCSRSHGVPDPGFYSSVRESLEPHSFLRENSEELQRVI